MNFSSADEMFKGMLRAVLRNGLARSARDKATLDIAGWTGVLLDPRNRFVSSPERALRPGYPAASVAWNLGMRPDAASICWWNPNGKFISDDGLTFRGANYGLRMLAQLNDVIDLLGEDPASRRTWVPIWGTRDDDFSLEYRRNGKDVPCMLGFGLSIVPGGRVDMEVVMRSQSAYGVFPYDLYLMSVVHELVANQLGVGLGFLHWHCMSLHVYANEIEKASRVIEETVKSESDTPIQINLETAMQMYPVVFQELTPVIATGNTIRWDANDPVVSQMLQGAVLINEQEAAKA